MDLKNYKQWLVCNPEQSKKPIGKTGDPVSWTDPKNWLTYDEACELVKHGIGTHTGFVLTTDDPFLLIDCDNKRRDKVVEDYINDLVMRADAKGHYCEQSVSGNGYHIFFKGNKNCTRTRHEDYIEYYSHSRFVIVTFESNGNDVIEDQALADYMDKLVGDHDLVAIDLDEDEPEVMTDDEVLDVMFTAQNGEDNRSLYEEPQGGGNDSELDQSLIERLCFFTKNNEQVRRLFKQSYRGKRGKVNTRGNEYIDRCIRFSRSVNATPLVKFDMQPLVQREPEAKEIDLTKIERECEFPPGIIGELANFFYINSMQPIKRYAIANALTTVAGITGRKFTINGSTSNLFMLIIGRTGLGKDSSRKALSELRKALAADNFSDFIGPESASGQALFASLQEQPCYCVYIGELTEDIVMMSRPGASDNAKTMMNAYLRLYDENVFVGKVHRDSSKNVEKVERPSVTILGSGTPDFFEHIDEYAVKRGLAPRFIMVEHHGSTPSTNRFIVDNGLTPPHPNIVKKMRSLIHAVRSNSHEVPVRYESDELVDEAIALSEMYSARADASTSQIEQGLYSRAYMNICRVAAVLASSMNPHDPVITREHWRWAKNFVNESLQNLLNKFSKGDLGADNHQFKQLEKLRVYLNEWLDMTAGERAKYNMSIKDRPLFIPFRYLSHRALNTNVFKSDQRGAQRALRDALMLLENNDELVKLTPADKKHYGVRGREVYARTDLNSSAAEYDSIANE